MRGHVDIGSCVLLFIDRSAPIPTLTTGCASAFEPLSLQLLLLGFFSTLSLLLLLLIVNRSRRSGARVASSS